MPVHCFFFFFFNDTATTEIYTLSLHDALPICLSVGPAGRRRPPSICRQGTYGRENRRGALHHRSSSRASVPSRCGDRSEEHTSELQSRLHLVCRLLLEKKKTNQPIPSPAVHFN